MPAPVLPVPEPPAIERPDPRIAELQATLERERESTRTAVAERDQLLEQLAATATTIENAQDQQLRLQEQYTGLQLELSQVVDELVETRAEISDSGSRALAASRIAEVKVQLNPMADSPDPEVQRRLQRAQEALTRADKELVTGNHGGAVYLADRAAEMLKQTRLIDEIRQATSELEGIIPIVPPRALEVTQKANLRAGPGMEASISGGASPRDRLDALARFRQWYLIETDAGLRAWIHSSLVVLAER